MEDFHTKDAVCAILVRKGFETQWFASERERNPGVLSEVSMVYGVRAAYKAQGAAPPAATVLRRAASRSASRARK